MKFKNLCSSTICFLLSILILPSCKKTETQASVQTPVDSGAIKKVYAWLDSQIANTTDTASVRKIKNLKDNLLSQGITSEIFGNNENLIIVPIKNTFKTVNVTNKPSLKNLVLIENDKSILRRGDIIEVIPQNQTLNSLPVGLVSSVYQNRTNSLNGLFSISTINNQFIYEIGYNNGKLSSTKFISPKKSANQGGKMNARTETCIAWYLETTNYYNDGSTEVSDEYLYTTCPDGDCNSTRLIDSSTPFKLECGDGAGADPNVNLIVVTVDTVQRNITDTCILKALNMVTNVRLKNTLTKAFQQVFLGVGTNANVQFTQVSSLYDDDGFTPLVARSQVIPGTQTWNVSINESVVSSISQEVLGEAMLHEMIHGFLTYYANAKGIHLSEDSTHMLIFYNWTIDMRDALVEIFGLSSTDATGLALQGMDSALEDDAGEGAAAVRARLNSVAISDLGMSLDTADSILADYTTGAKGIRCP